MPTDKGIRLHVLQGITPGKHSVQGDHNKASGIIGQPWLDLALLEQRQLFSEEKILRGKGAVRPHSEEDELAQVEQDCGCCEEAMLDGCSEKEQEGHEVQDRTLREVTNPLFPATNGVFAEYNQSFSFVPELTMPSRLFISILLQVKLLKKG